MQIHAVGHTFSQTHLNEILFEFLSNYNVTVLTYRLVQRITLNKNDQKKKRGSLSLNVLILTHWQNETKMLDSSMKTELHQNHGTM